MPKLSRLAVQIRKWRYYANRYGAIHAAAAYAGRKVPWLWPLVGPYATKRYLLRWVSQSGPKLVNLGSGSNLIQGFLNADISPRSDVYVDITRPLPFPGNSIDGIICEELIEHVDFPQALGLRDELFRVLRPTGVVRITTPDLTYVLRLADTESPRRGLLSAEARAFLGTGEIGPATERMGAANSFFYGHEHRCLYTLAGLVELFQAGGFEVLRISEFKDPASSLGIYDSHAERYDHPAEMSIYVEFVKPQRVPKV